MARARRHEPAVAELLEERQQELLAGESRGRGSPAAARSSSVRNARHEALIRDQARLAASRNVSPGARW